MSGGKASSSSACSRLLATRGQECPTPLGTGTWSGGFRAQWQRRKPRSPSPQPSPWERENYRPRGDKARHPDRSNRKVEGRRSKVEGRRSKVEGRRSKVEGRRSKVERRPKPEGRSPNRAWPRVSGFGFRPSAFFRPSGFGLRTSTILGHPSGMRRSIPSAMGQECPRSSYPMWWVFQKSKPRTHRPERAGAREDACPP
jgi:hypothetical protein